MDLGQQVGEGMESASAALERPRDKLPLADSGTVQLPQFLLREQIFLWSSVCLLGHPGFSIQTGDMVIPSKTGGKCWLPGGTWLRACVSPSWVYQRSSVVVLPLSAVIYTFGPLDNRILCADTRPF